MKYVVLASSLLMSCALELPGSGPSPIDEVTTRDPIVETPGAAPTRSSSSAPASGDPQSSAPPSVAITPSSPSSNPSAPAAQPMLDAGSADDDAGASEPPDAGAFTLTSSAFDDGARLPSAFTCRGADVSPPLAWRDVPADTRSFALVLTSKSARAGTSLTVEWVLWGIPATRSSLPQGVDPGRQPNNVASAQQHSREEEASGGFTAGGFAGGGFTAGGFGGAGAGGWGGATFGGNWPGAAGGVPGVPVSVPGVPGATPGAAEESEPRYRGPCGSSDKQLEFTLFALESGAPRGASMDIEAVEAWLDTREHVIAAASLSATFP